MTTSELLKTVRRVEVRTNRPVNDTMVGAYLSQFRGREMLRFPVMPPIVPKGQNMNSRGCQPTVDVDYTFDPVGVGPLPNDKPWVSPTAIRVWPLRGRKYEFERFGNCGEFAIIKSWMRNRNTVEFIRGWEQIHSSDFKGLEFETFRNQAAQSNRQPPDAGFDGHKFEGVAGCEEKLT